MLTKATTVRSNEASVGKGSICGFSQNTPITCTAQAQNLVGFGLSVSEDVSTTEEDTISGKLNNGR